MADELTAVFFSQGGRKYHRTQDCHALESAQVLWDGDSPDDYPLGAPWFGGYAVRRAPEHYAYYLSGKRPCLVCLPGRGVPFASAADFGHRPVSGFIDGRAIGLICRRCRIVHRNTTIVLDGDLWTMGSVSTVRWPCVSAIVLGVADQEASSLPRPLPRAA